jgi:tetratricopeptide (TPR) repeat protein
MSLRFKSAVLVALLASGSIALELPGRSSVAVAQSQVDPRKVEAERLLKQGLQQYRASQFAAALQFWQQALTLYRQVNDRRGEGATLGNLGITYDALGNYAKAIEYHQQALV